MALSNRDRVHRGLDALREALIPFVERSLRSRLGKDWEPLVERGSQLGLPRRPDGKINWDTQRLLRAITDNWTTAFKQDLSGADRAFVGELIDVRNRFAHEEPFSSDDTARALDTTWRLLTSLGAKPQAEAVYQLRDDLKRTVVAEQARNQTRYATLPLEGVPLAGLKPWREVATPHRDVATGNFRVAEFAANLGHVAAGRASPEYADPKEFYARTFITAGLWRLLADAVKRLTNTGGEPVVNLQTSFGGGKTHSMLALYHLVTARDPATLSGVGDVMAELGLGALPPCGRAVLVGTELQPAQPSRKPDGTVVRTMWGELAWQLGNTKSGALTSGAEAYALLAESDAAGTSPGAALGTLLELAAPCLVLIDEWVAFVRQVRFRDDLPAGTFGANMTFAQTLTEQIAGVPGALLVASLPQSTIEIGGDAGQEALDQLSNFFRRVHSTWTPATASEGYEIVRRRLFEPIAERDAIAARAATVKAFTDLYRKEQGDFPAGVAEKSYADLMLATYPVHPALFQTLYDVWSALPKFQQTRGVLRLMANVIHQLWSTQDKGLMILPASIPMDGPIAGQLLEYLGDAWGAVVEKDVDGPACTALRIDRANPALMRYSAARRVARSAFLASAPTASVGQNPGVDEKAIRLGAVQPGETGATFGDALRKLSDQATYLYKDGPRHWFNTQPNVNRLAEERAHGYDEETIREAVVELVKEHARAAGRAEFSAVHPCPAGSDGVPDEPNARLVILGPEACQAGRGTDTDAVRAAETVLKSRGQAQRMHRNVLVFLAPDAQVVGRVKQQVRLLKAWASIVEQWETLQLDPHQRRTAETQRKEAERAVASQIGECWKWLLAPEQPDPANPVLSWSIAGLSGADPLPVRAARKLVSDERLILNLGPQRLKRELDTKGLWGDGPHVPTETLWKYFASYPYLPRLRDADVLAQAIDKGLDLAGATFGYAAEVTADGVYLDLTRTRGPAPITAKSVLLKADEARRIENAQAPPAPEAVGGDGDSGGVADGRERPNDAQPLGELPQTVVRDAPRQTRYFGSIEISPDRAVRDFGAIATEVLAHLVALRGAKVTLRLDIDAKMPNGFPQEAMRVVLENGSALKFDNNRFDED